MAEPWRSSFLQTSQADFKEFQEQWIQEMWNFLKEPPPPSLKPFFFLSLFFSSFQLLVEAVGLKESLMDREAGLWRCLLLCL